MASVSTIVVTVIVTIVLLVLSGVALMQLVFGPRRHSRVMQQMNDRVSTGDEASSFYDGDDGGYNGGYDDSSKYPDDDNGQDNSNGGYKGGGNNGKRPAPRDNGNGGPNGNGAADRAPGVTGEAPCANLKKGQHCVCPSGELGDTRNCKACDNPSAKTGHATTFTHEDYRDCPLTTYTPCPENHFNDASSHNCTKCTPEKNPSPTHVYAASCNKHTGDRKKVDCKTWVGYKYGWSADFNLVLRRFTNPGKNSAFRSVFTKLKEVADNHKGILVWEDGLMSKKGSVTDQETVLKAVHADQRPLLGVTEKTEPQQTTFAISHSDPTHTLNDLHAFLHIDQQIELVVDGRQYTAVVNDIFPVLNPVVEDEIGTSEHRDKAKNKAGIVYLLKPKKRGDRKALLTTTNDLITSPTNVAMYTKKGASFYTIGNKMCAPCIATADQKCEAGTGLVKTDTKCTFCTRGDSTQCVPCKPGTYNDGVTDDSTCKPCDKNACPENMEYHGCNPFTGKAVCHPCGTEYHKEDDACKDCPPTPPKKDCEEKAPAPPPTARGECGVRRIAC